MTEKEKIACLRLTRTESIGSRLFWGFIRKYGSAEQAIEAIKSENKLHYEICDESQVVAEIENNHKIGAEFIFYDDNLYPPLLKKIADAPPVLSFIGNRDALKSFNHRKVISVVGARNSSIMANKFCVQLVDDLGRSDVVIASGLARGIDAHAHMASLEYGTIAVLASGIDIIYPQENARLYSQIKEKGAIFAEMPFGTAPQAHLFPKRNRIIAGISMGTVIIEAAKKSGSLITAKYALEYNRDVFAVPGFPLDIRSEGGNNLIKEGAVIVLSAQDILDYIAPSCHQEEIQFNNCSPLIESEETDKCIKGQILNSLSTTPITIDELISSIKLPPQKVLTAVIELELENKVASLPGQKICLLSTS